MDAFICDAVRTPIGRYGGALSSVRADDLAAAPIAALMARHPGLDWAAVEDVIYGCANQAGEDNCWPGCRWRCPAPPSTGSAGREWTRWAWRRGRSAPATATC